MASQRIFITGATGYIGTLVTTLALKEGYAVHGLSRSASGAAKLQALGAVAVKGDLSSLEVLRDEAAQADIVVHLADAWIDDFSQPYENVIRIDGAAVSAMVDGLARSKSGRKLFIGTSGAGVVQPDENDAETDENTPEHPNPMNGRIKCEQHALSLAGTGTGADGNGVKVCVMRLPPFVYGRGGSGARLFMDVFAKLGYVVRIDEGLTKTCVVHVDDAARAYLLAAKHACTSPGKVTDIYNVTSSTDVTFREFTDAFAATMDLPVRQMSVAEAMGTAGPLVTGFFSGSIRGKSDKARRELGWTPTEVGIVEDIRNGSYVEVAREIKASVAAKV
ncbi:NAD dependent epimerase/dehydratase [Xylariaceae sp. AK1471]|nr:NAD dependent epimerase/dehydratase [Xylariaceae sp. AK1471]